VAGLVTPSGEEKAPARRGRRSRCRRGLQHDGEDEDELVLDILDEGVRWVGLGRVGLLLMGSC
jgi:hypothetical protein